MGCPSYTQLPEQSMSQLQKLKEGKMLWLKQSMYVGTFYDDDRYRLIDPRRFEELRYLRDAEGEIIPPPPSTGIVPAGTRVRLERIDFPVGENVWRRPIYSPRYTTWLLLRVARDRGDVTLERQQKHILLLPAFLKDEKSFEHWFDSLLAEEDPNPAIRDLPTEQRVGIDSKTPVVGMSRQTLTMALGFPDRMRSETQTRDEENVEVEVAVYGATSVVLENGIVTRVRIPQVQATQPKSQE